jgi:hypothetical protein
MPHFKIHIIHQICSATTTPSPPRPIQNRSYSMLLYLEACSSTSIRRQKCWAAQSCISSKRRYQYFHQSTGNITIRRIKKWSTVDYPYHENKPQAFQCNACIMRKMLLSPKDGILWKRLLYLKARTS